MKTASLYVHIPFCDTICRYCDFCKVYYDHKLADEYLEVLKAELEELKIDHQLKTIYIGGGTPSSLTEEQLEFLLDMLKPYSQGIEEYCIEVNPESMDLFKLRILQQGGITRLSIGVQTFQDQLLKLIDRRHSSQQVLRLISQAQNMGFNNISVDLMYGLPEQTLADVQKDLEIVRNLDVQHISYYALILEDHTILKYKHYQPIDEEMEYQINCCIDETLKAYGYDKYEISNYAKNGFASKHNLVYWHYENYYGIGVGAASKIDDCIIEHSRSLTKYLNRTAQSQVIRQDKQETMFNHVMMSLRLTDGLDLETFQRIYDEDVRTLYQQAISKNDKRGLLEITDGHLRTTAKGMYLLNDILIDFMNEKDW